MKQSPPFSKYAWLPIALIFIALALLYPSQFLWAAEETSAGGETIFVEQAGAGSLNEATSLLAAIFKVAGALGVVVLLMMAVVYFLKKTGLSQGGFQKGSLIKVLESKMVAPKKYIAIVEVAGKPLAIGISDNNISMLTDLAPEKVAVRASEQQNETNAKENKKKNFAQSLADSVQAVTQKLAAVSPSKETR